MRTKTRLAMVPGARRGRRGNAAGREAEPRKPALARSSGVDHTIGIVDLIESDKPRVAGMQADCCDPLDAGLVIEIPARRVSGAKSIHPCLVPGWR